MQSGACYDTHMCGRCAIFNSDEVLELIWQIETGLPVTIASDGQTRAQAYPKSLAPLIVPRFDTAVGQPALPSGSLAMRELSWGFEESWKPGVVFNTRIESASKPTWRESMEHRRCIIPVPSFFETSQTETFPSPRTGKPIKRPYEFRIAGEEVILIGCIWRGESFSMVTTEANVSMAPIHHRMPLIVCQSELPLWFGSGYLQLADRSAIRLESRPAI